MSENQSVAIIGSGVAGLSAAIHLAHAGKTVEVFEANNYPGGKLCQIEGNGYRFDAGPSLFTLPEKVDSLLSLAGIGSNQFSYIKLDRICRYHYADGQVLNAWSDKIKFGQEIKDKLNIDPELVYNYLNKAKTAYELTSPVFLDSSLHLSKTYFTQSWWKALINMLSLPLTGTINSLNKNTLEHPKLIQYFNRYATYNGSDPYRAPSMLTLIPHLEHNLGSYFPAGGMISITNQLYKAALKLGVSFHFNSYVDAIEVSDKKVQGIRLGNRVMAFQSVFSNMDIYPTYQKLLSGYKAPVKILNQEKSSSGIVFYWGIKRTFPELDLHNVFFSGDYQNEFDTIFRNKTISDDPTVYLNISSKYNPDDAPTGCENWFVMINTPPNTGQNWDELIAKARKNVINKLNKLLNVQLESYIAFEKVLDPRTIEINTSSHLGSLYGNASNNRLSAFLRHPNFSRKIDGLYFCGGSVHPGGGIPLCINSGKLAAELFLQR